ncbi:MAG: MerR family transcriptional regulator [Deltaproteobacteria bacterium]|nr:MerR family transcriptional regulator [Deltaproteobacteria bacterium]MBF0507805.1 MerR family transcriptional regulator [Deltaproteobacteria bacterium]MBF0525522.1 MerR family transcriptional regulator [Deltaproteobacteria bacterium]
MRISQFSEPEAPFIPKEGINIGEVSNLLSVPRSTLLFWEKEFGSFLSVKKTGGKHRRYTNREVEALGEIKRLLNEEKYTVAGAKRRMEMTRQQTRSFEQILTDALGKLETGMKVSDVARNMARQMAV